MAETWFPNKEKGRVFSVKAGDCLREDINPVVKAGGFAKACAEEFKNIHVKDGLLSIELKGGVGVSGIEIRRAD
jgi:hypothetical protein